MKNFIIILIFYLSGTSLSIGQEPIAKPPAKSFTVYINSPLFYNYFGDYSFYVLTANLEYILQKTEKNRTSFSFGYGREFIGDLGGRSYTFIQSEITNIYGYDFYYLDIGAGLATSGDLDITGRLGIRLEPGKRFLLRAAYTPYIRTGLFTSNKIIESTDSFLTVSMGYRFGKPQNKGNNKFE